MPTPTELALMTSRRKAAHSATKFFKKIKSVRSTNNPFAFTTPTDQLTLNQYRNNNPDTIVQAFDDAAGTGIGNCDEKGRICYAALRSNPTILQNSHVSLVEAVNYDHVFVVVADAQVAAATDLQQLGVTAMIVDGWTEDWYFPNINVITAKLNSLGNTPNPRQLYVRIMIEKHQFQPYGGIGNMVPDM